MKTNNNQSAAALFLKNAMTSNRVDSALSGSISNNFRKSTTTQLSNRSTSNLMSQSLSSFSKAQEFTNQLAREKEKEESIIEKHPERLIDSQMVFRNAMT